jgi:hypothetical protein
MKVKMILPALTEATSPFWRPIKYSLFPPLGLATLAAYLGDAADVEIQDEHVEVLDLTDAPDLEDTWPQFLADFRQRCPKRIYQSTLRTLAGVPPIRRDLIERRLYLVPNSIVVSRGCPHVCDFCYKEAFFEGADVCRAGVRFRPARHLPHFLDDHFCFRLTR